MLTRLAAHKAATGALDGVTAADGVDFLAWVNKQKEVLAWHFQGKAVPLSDDRVARLKALGYVQDVQTGSVGGSSVMDAATAERRWEEMFADLVRYRDERGSFEFGNFQRLAPRDRPVCYWARQQRVEFQKVQRGEASSLTALRLRRLTDVGFDVAPKPERIPWDEKMQSLREFAAAHGHCKPPVDHPLTQVIYRLRRLYCLREEGDPGGKSLTDERLVRQLSCILPMLP